jgi:hypothetical protein
MNEQAMNPNAPAFARSNPRAYYAWLTSQGLGHREAYDQTTGVFGQPKTPQQIAEEEAAAKQKGGLAQTGGAVAGSLIANEAMRGFPNIGGLFSSGSGASTAGAQAGASAAGSSGAAAIPGAVPTPPLLGGESALGAQAGGSTLSSIGSVALPVAAVLAVASNAWETGMKDILRGRGNRADWINQGANITGVGEIANMGLRMMGKRSIGAMMTSGKSNAQALRDDFRGDLKESGVADKDYMVTLADGSKFNIGLDGKTKYKNTDEKTTRNAWDVDWSNPLAKFASDKIDPMIRGIYGADDPKAKFFPGQYTGMLVNAAASNAKNEAEVMANIEAMMGKSKFAKQAGVGITPPKPQKPPKGEVVRVSPGMYMNDKGQVGPAKTVKEALRANYGKTKEKK